MDAARVAAQLKTGMMTLQSGLDIAAQLNAHAAEKKVVSAYRLSDSSLAFGSTSLARLIEHGFDLAANRWQREICQAI